MKDLRTIVLRSLVIVAVLTIAASTCVGRAAATVPIIVSIKEAGLMGQISSGGGTIPVWNDAVEVTINHPNPSSTHYIDKIEAEYKGQTVSATEPAAIQTADTFTDTVILGPNDAKAVNTVRVRAHCTVDGWSAWSSTINVPEFPVAGIMAFLVVAVSLFVVKSAYHASPCRAKSERSA